MSDTNAIGKDVERAGLRVLRRMWVAALIGIALLLLAVVGTFYILNRRVADTSYHDHLVQCLAFRDQQVSSNEGRKRQRRSLLIDAKFFDAAATARAKGGTQLDEKTAQEYHSFAQQKRDLASEITTSVPINCVRVIEKP